MGYADTLPLSQFELYPDLALFKITISTIATDYNLGYITIPTDFKGRVTHAYLDLLLIDSTDTSGAENYIDGANWLDVSSDAGVSYTFATGLVDGCINVRNNSSMSGGRVNGLVDISAKVNECLNNGNTLLIRFKNAKCHANNLIIRNFNCVLRLIK